MLYAKIFLMFRVMKLSQDMEGRIRVRKKEKESG